jgi:cytochrome c biogenesis protein CcdA
MAEIINTNMWLAPLFAILAGIITSLTPCSLSSVPLVIGYVGGTGSKNTKKAFLYSLTFSLGMAITFVILGVIATSAGKLMGSANTWWYYVLGTLMVLMALQTWEVFNFIPSTNLLSKNKTRGFLGALIAGILGGVFSSPCSTPVLIVLLALISGKSMIWGCILMLLYALGNSFLVIIAGTSLGFIQKINNSHKYKIVANILKYTMGALILLIGLYMFWVAF